MAIKLQTQLQIFQALLQPLFLITVLTLLIPTFLTFCHSEPRVMEFQMIQRYVIARGTVERTCSYWHNFLRIQSTY
jgi:hypothetical protein